MQFIPPRFSPDGPVGDMVPARDRRPKPRKSTLVAGVAVYLDGSKSFDCSIFDMSETGARIAIPKNVNCPAQFFLVNVPGRMTHVATVIWRRGGEVGVSFASSLPLAKVGKPALSFLTRAWLERAAR